MSTTSGRPGGTPAARPTATPRPSASPAPRPGTTGTARPGTGAGGAPPAGRPARQGSPTAAVGDTEPRKVKLTVSRVDPFSVMKISFMLSVAIGLAGVVVVAVLWIMLDTMGVFSAINDTLNEMQQSTPADRRLSVMEFLGFGKVLSLSVVIGVIDVILMTAIATIVAVIYNICSALVGGMHVTLTDD